MPDTEPSAAPPERPTSEPDVYAIHGADPEVLAYAMARYSRSAMSLRESLAEISAQRAEQFLNTFYFQYGHRSIADLAHIPMAIERLSLLAAIEVVDEQRWDGQERSTRYQDFRRSGWHTPDLGSETAGFTTTVEALFAAYHRVGSGMQAALRERVPRPEAMSAESYDRTLKARAFDVARYVLPLATNTSLGQITNARTLETQVSRLLSSRFAEVRRMGERMRAAASEPAWNLQHRSTETMRERIAEQAGGGAAADLAEAVARPVRSAPTLVKYAAPSPYLLDTRQDLAQAAAELMRGRSIDPAPVVDLLDDEPLEVEIATSLLYPHTHYPYRQLRSEVAGMTAGGRAETTELGRRHRGAHDELLRAFSAGGGLRFDILMDIGGFRDMHRHRRCVQLLQGYTDAHGYELPEFPGQPTLAEAGLGTEYRAAMEGALGAFRRLREADVPEAEPSACYVLPLGLRCRSMFKMDFAQALYMAELRSGPAGHYSYRRVAWLMFQAVAERYPALAGHFRVEDVRAPIDLLRR